MHGQAYLFSLKEIYEDFSVSEEDKILWVPHNKLKNGHNKMFAFILHRLVHKLSLGHTFVENL